MRTAPTSIFLTAFLATSLAVFLTTFALGENAAAAADAACGPKDTNFDVKDDNSQHTVGQPQGGEALVYMIQDIGVVNCIGACLTTKIGLDGTWIGANHRNSYFTFAVEPGERHLCANWQSHLGRLSREVALAHFTAEPGKIYYFRTRSFGDKAQILFDLDPIDSDLGKYYVATLPLSVSHPKK
jgi:hypothetical protein